MKNCWLPEIEQVDANNWNLTSESLYDIFYHDFIQNRVFYKGLPVNVRKYPRDDNKEEAYYHVTCKDYTGNKERSPDFRRSERIRWIRAFIDNYHKCEKCELSNCDGIKIWEEPYKNGNTRVMMLLEEERYIVILERRNGFYLLITAYYLDYDHSLKKCLNKYNQYVGKL